MCGIAGFVFKPEVPQKKRKELVTKMGVQLQQRGIDATGVYTNRGKNGWTVVKAPVPASKFKFPNEYGDLVLVHCRAATIGSPQQNVNNHPLVGKKWVLIHNGIVYMSRLANWKYRGWVDSEILLSYLEVYGIKKGLSKVYGSAAVAFCKKIDPDVVYLWRWRNPLVVVSSPKIGVIWASTEDILRAAVNVKEEVRELEVGELLAVDIKTREIKELSKVEGKEPAVRVYNYGGRLSRGSTSTLRHRSYSYCYSDFRIWARCDVCGWTGWSKKIGKKYICERCYLGGIDEI